MTIWILSVSPSTSEQDAEKGRQHKKIVVWSVWFVWFIWSNKTSQMNQTNQKN